MDPLALERTYRTARHTLSLLTGPRNRLLHLVELIELLNAPATRAALPAYAGELVPLFADIVRRLKETGVPAELAGRADAAIATLQGIAGSSQSVRSTIAATREALASVVPAAPPSSPPLRRGEVAVRIPMVEEEYLLPGFTPLFASVARVRVEIRMGSVPGPDEIHMARFTPAQTANDALLDPLRAALLVLERWKGIRTPRPVTAYCSSEGVAAVSGGSLGAGLAVALVCALLRTTLYREEFTPCADAAFTGALDAQGRLLPVAPTGLRVKAEECARAGLRYLVVPAEQAELAARVVDELRTGPPSSPADQHFGLKVIAVRTVGEIFHDRRLVASARVPAAIHTARRLWRHRRPAAAVLFVGLLFIIGRLWYGPVDREPTHVRFGGTMMTIHNRSDEKIQEIRVGEATATMGSMNFTPFSALHDMDGDGRKEVFWLENNEALFAAVGMVHCRTVGEDTNRWTVMVSKHLSFPENRVEGDQFGVFALTVADPDRDSVPEVFVIARHQDFPSLLLKLDARRGTELGCYVHAGHIMSLQVVDFERDGREEIAVSGISNAMGEAFLAVLDPQRLDGHGPVQGKYTLEGVPRAAELAYLLFPKTIVHESYPDRVRWTTGTSIAWSTVSHMVRVTIMEYPTGVDPDNERVTYYVHLSDSLRPLVVQTGDDFDALADKYIRERKIRNYPDAAYWARYLQRIRFFRGGRTG